MGLGVARGLARQALEALHLALIEQGIGPYIMHDLGLSPKTVLSRASGNVQNDLVS